MNGECEVLFANKTRCFRFMLLVGDVTLLQQHESAKRLNVKPRVHGPFTVFCFMGSGDRKERGNVRCLTKDMSWIHTSSSVSTRSGCWPAEAASRPQEVWIWGLFFIRSGVDGRNRAAGKRPGQNERRGGVLRVVQVELLRKAGWTARPRFP